MRRVTPKALSLFIAVTVFMSPLLGWADMTCRCPDCARSECVIRSRLCNCAECPEPADTVPTPEQAGCQGCSTVAAQPCPNANSNEPEHAPESKGCQCNAYVYTHGSAVLPMEDSGSFAIAEEFFQQTPRTFVTSGWVYQILHPPRSLAS